MTQLCDVMPVSSDGSKPKCCHSNASVLIFVSSLENPTSQRVTNRNTELLVSVTFGRFSPLIILVRRNHNITLQSTKQLTQDQHCITTTSPYDAIFPFPFSEAFSIVSLLYFSLLFLLCST